MIAVNAVMAGCRPEYFPVVLAAVEAMVQPAYNLYGRQTTTHPGAHLLLIHGPIRRELEVNCRFGLLGHGMARTRRSAAPCAWCASPNKPGITDMNAHGHPGKYSYCMGEDEEGSPWSPLHVERGYAAETSAVTVICAEAPHNVNDQVSKTPERYLRSAASAMSHLGANGIYRASVRGEQCLLMSGRAKERWIADHGWSKDDVKKFLFEAARQPIRELRDRGSWDFIPLPRFVDATDEKALVPIVNRYEDILVLVGGGDMHHMNVILTAAHNLSVTRPIAFKDGTPIKSVKDFL